MKLSFTQTIEGHEIEFVRLMFPLRYEVFVQKAEGGVLKFTMSKNGSDWTISQQGDAPGWVNEISVRIQDAIELNEAEQ